MGLTLLTAIRASCTMRAKQPLSRGAFAEALRWKAGVPIASIAPPHPDSARGSTVDALDALIDRAIGAGASDIHLEPQTAGGRIRFRIDGILRPHLTLPSGLFTALCARVKLIGELDLGERRLPQDGRTAFARGERTYETRIATLPGVLGEKLVIRLFDRDGGLRTLEELGMLAAERLRYEAMLRKPHGLVLIAGPTGSGKTTTLYASIPLLEPQRRNVTTVEDPVERYVPEITQVQVHSRAGMTFPVALRALLRQDPDVMVIGEIRDGDSARLAVSAALTGHLVLATIHVNDADGAAARLRDLGVEAHALDAALRCVVAQRLVPRSGGGRIARYELREHGASVHC
ncbi:type II/IV secretion system protein [bacterium]|nr:MAG: type II/IV secretion system protein [bacterium]